MSILGLASSRHDDLAEAAKYDHAISLIDHTAPDFDPQAPSSGSQTPTTPSSSLPLSQRLTRNSLREDLAKRGLARQKYAKYQEGRTISSTETIELNRKKRIQSEDQQSDSEPRIARTATRLERSKRRVRGILNSKKAKHHAKDEDAVVDILYENQRGSFFFGIPLFSAKSLLNFDPAPWLNGRFKPSPVDITNAQCPDPSWAWTWPNWYVDMSHDVDEEGWEYSFSWKRGGAWHGTHPWLHSFVRRRRWLRMRVRKHAQLAAGNLDAKRLSDAHKLNADYFTIHPARAQDASGNSSAANSMYGRSRSRSILHERSHPDLDAEEDEEIRDVPTLLLRLKRAAVDREKIAVVRNFLQNGGDELFYLAEQMQPIMSLLIFQSSRRSLLALLLRHTDAAAAHRAHHAPEAKDKANAEAAADHHIPEETEADAQTRHINALHAALIVADQLCKKLEFWSDIRDLAQRGEVVGAAEEGDGWGAEWGGVEGSGPGLRVGALDIAEEGGGEDGGRGSGGGERGGFVEDEDVGVGGIGGGGGWGGDGADETGGAGRTPTSPMSPTSPTTPIHGMEGRSNIDVLDGMGFEGRQGRQGRRRRDIGGDGGGGSGSGSGNRNANASAKHNHANSSKHDHNTTDTGARANPKTSPEGPKQARSQLEAPASVDSVESPAPEAVALPDSPASPTSPHSPHSPTSPERPEPPESPDSAALVELPASPKSPAPPTLPESPAQQLRPQRSWIEQAFW